MTLFVYATPLSIWDIKIISTSSELSLCSIMLSIFSFGLLGFSQEEEQKTCQLLSEYGLNRWGFCLWFHFSSVHLLSQSVRQNLQTRTSNSDLCNTKAASFVNILSSKSPPTHTTRSPPILHLTPPIPTASGLCWVIARIDRVQVEKYSRVGAHRRIRENTLKL